MGFMSLNKVVEANDDLLQDETESCQLFLFVLLVSLPLNMSLAKCLHTKNLKKKGFPLAIDILRKVYIVSSAILLD